MNLKFSSSKLPQIIDSYTDSVPNDTIRIAFKEFVDQPFSYRKQFLQSEFIKAFDGYSFIGQEDSLNQYSTDMLHSFVFSEFTDAEKFPKEFQLFIKEDFPRLKQQVQAFELECLDHLGNSELKTVYEENFGHMVSCNFYPKPSDCKVVGFNETRLSNHVDVSLFSVFPCGLKEGLSYLNNQTETITLGTKRTMFGFAGYGLEMLSQGSVTALKHQVDLPKQLDEERFSMAFFSIPKPDASFAFLGKHYNAKDYYSDYLNLF